MNRPTLPRSSVARLLPLVLALCLLVTRAANPVAAQDADDATADDAVAAAVDGLWVERYPIAADGAQTVRDARGRQYPATGRGCSTWLKYGSAGSWKRFAVTPGEPVVLVVGGDADLIDDVRFRLTGSDRDGQNADREPALTFAGPHGRSYGTKRWLWFVPRREAFTLQATGRNGLYVYQVWQRLPATRALAEDEAAAVDDLLAKLATADDDERPALVAALVTFGPRAASRVAQAREAADDDATRARLTGVLEQLVGGAVTSGRQLRAEANRGLDQMVARLADARPGSAEMEEAARNLFAAGPLVAHRAVGFLDHESQAVQAAALASVPTGEVPHQWLVQLASPDNPTSIRVAAVRRLAESDTPATRRLLVDLAFTDDSRDVAVAALMALRELGYHPDDAADSDDMGSDDE